MGIEHAATARAQHIPCQIEQAQPRRVEEAGNHPLLVEPGLPGKIQDVDPVELVVLAFLDEPGNCIGHRRIGGLPQYRKMCLNVAHAGALDEGERMPVQDALSFWTRFLLAKPRPLLIRAGSGYASPTLPR